MTNSTVVAEFNSKSEPGKIRRVALSKAGSLYCDCPGFSWRNQCRHVLEYTKKHPVTNVDLVVRTRISDQDTHPDDVRFGLQNLENWIGEVLTGEDYLSVELHLWRDGLRPPEVREYNVALVGDELVTVEQITNVR